MSNRKRSTLDLGHDAFLDIVANLVGILIILVVVLGTQSTNVIREMRERVSQEVEQKTETKYASDQQLSDLAQAAMRASAAQADSNRLEKMAVKYDLMVAQKRRERDVLLDLLTQVRKAWEEKQLEFDEQKREQAKLQSELEEVNQQLAQLRGQRHQLENAPEPEVVAVSHLPTPMAKTVFGDEVHFRLKGDRLSVIPIDQLGKQIERDLARVLQSKRDGMMDSVVGPVRGYVANFQMAKMRTVINQGGRVSMGTNVQVQKVTFEPLREPHGQPIDTVLSNSSILDIELAGRDPNTTAITIWVYPDSFESLRTLRENLYRRGFATASRPLKPGRHVTASPNGSRSRAQ